MATYTITLTDEEEKAWRWAMVDVETFLLNAQARRFHAGEAVDNYVDPQSLPIQERYLLRHALEATGRLQGLVHASFGDIFF